MEAYKNTAEAMKRKCEQDPENTVLWQEYARFMLESMKETHMPVLNCDPVFDAKQILIEAMKREPENIRTLRNRAYKSIAAEAAAGKALLYEAAQPLVHDGRLDQEAWKKTLLDTAPALSRIVKAGELTAEQLLERGIRYDGHPDSMCWTLVEHKDEQPILTPVFALCDLLLASNTPEDPSSLQVVRLSKPAYHAEEFLNAATDEAVEQWNDMKYCPYCFKRDLRMTMSGRRRCKACRAVIKPFEVYRPQ